MPETTLLNSVHPIEIKSVHPIEIKRDTGGPPRTVTPSDGRGDGDLRRQVIVDIGSRRLCGAEVFDIFFHDVGALGCPVTRTRVMALSPFENSCHGTVTVRVHNVAE